MKMSAANIIPRLHWWNDADSGKEKYPEKKNAQGHFSSFFNEYIAYLLLLSFYLCFLLILKDMKEENKCNARQGRMKHKQAISTALWMFLYAALVLHS